MSYIGTNKVGKMYLGSTAIGKAYLGNDLVYDSAGGGQVLPYDAEIEYLQSSGTQYIDTGISPSTNFECEIKAEFTQNQAGYDTLLGSYTSTSEYGVALAIRATYEANAGYIQFGANGSGTSLIVSSIQTLGLHTYKTSLKNSTLKVDVDGTVNSLTWGNGQSPSSLPMYMFARNKGGGTIGNYSKAKVYYCKIWNGGNLVFDAIPVRVGQVGYMYDRVSRQLLGNAGSGDFALGGDIIGNGAYIKCSYVVPSSSSAIFTTGVTALGSEWELDLQDTVTTSGNQVFICSNDNGGCFAAVNSSGKFALGASNVMASASTRTTVGIEFIDKGTIMTIGSGNTQRIGTVSHNQYVSLLGYNDNYLYKGRIYGIKCVSGGSFDAVPARRISDGVYGLYDTANDVFYTNFTGA